MVTGWFAPVQPDTASLPPDLHALIFDGEALPAPTHLPCRHFPELPKDRSTSSFPSLAGYSPADVTMLSLRSSLLQSGEHFLGKPVDGAELTVACWFARVQLGACRRLLHCGHLRTAVIEDSGAGHPVSSLNLVDRFSEIQEDRRTSSPPII